MADQEKPSCYQHNKSLSDAYLKEHRVFARWPKVSDQIQTLPLTGGIMFPNGYNPTITARGDNIMMCYRYHDGKSATNLALAVISKEGVVAANLTLLASNGTSHEDAKFFTHNGDLCVSFVLSRWPASMRAVVKYGKMNDATIADIVWPQIGKNDFSACEKNWVFFQHGESLYCIYASHPEQKVYEQRGEAWAPLDTIAGPIWPYGDIKGGTPPIEYDGKLLRFFHSTLDNEPGQFYRRYYVGACLHDPNPPFKPVACSRRPIIYGSESGSLTAEQRRQCRHYKPKVVFPGGAIASNGYWLLSLGANDCECLIAKVTPENLNL